MRFVHDPVRYGSTIPTRGRTLREILDDDRHFGKSATLREFRRATTLERFLARKVGRADAEDIAQEAYFRFLTSPKLHELRFPAGFLFKIALNVLSEQERRKAKEPEIHCTSRYEHYCRIQDDAEQHVVAESVTQTKIIILHKYLRPRDLEILHMRYALDFSHEAIAFRLGISKSSVSKYLARAMRKARAPALFRDFQRLLQSE